VVAFISDDGPSVRLWIDGIFIDENTAQNPIDPDSQWASHEDASYGLATLAGTIPTNEVDLDYAGNGSRISSVMRMYQPATLQVCTAGSVLAGDWVSSSNLQYSCCEACPANSQVNASIGIYGSTSCLCNSGYTGTNGGACVACAQGTYKTSLGSQLCALCSNGYYIVPADSVSGAACSACAAGTFNNSMGATACEKCAVGTYNIAAGGTGCTECSNTTTTSSDGATSCNNCVRNALPRYTVFPIGSYQDSVSTNESVCVECPANAMPSLCMTRGECTMTNLANCTCNTGFYGTINSTGGGPCATCPFGTTTVAQGAVNITECVCDAGYEGNTSGTACTRCRSGFRKTVVGMGSCSQCGTTDIALVTTSEDGTICICKRGAYRLAGRCELCPAGKAKDVSGDKACVSCTKGTYQPVKGQGICFQCPRAKFNTKIGMFGSECFSCKSCPTNTDSGKASQARSTCVSNAGYSGRDGNVGVACAVGTYKQVNGSSACQACVVDISVSTLASVACSCNLGYFSATPDVDGANCTACPVAYAANVTGLASCNMCGNNSYTANNGTGSTTCLQCPYDSSSFAGSRQQDDCSCNVGYTGAPPSSNCSACFEGTYKTFPGPAVCDICAANSYQHQRGSTACIDCHDFSESLAGSQNLSMCQCIGGFKHQLLERPVVELRSRVLVRIFNSSNPCSNLTNTSNAFSSGNSSIVQMCNVTEDYEYTYYENITVCVGCAAGKARAGLGNSQCEACIADSNSNPGQEYCTCNFGYVQNDGHASPCSLCTLRSNHNTHPLVAIGITSTNADEKCDAGKWWRECTAAGDSGCVPCSANSHSTYGSEGQESCKCNKGFSGPDGGPCVQCSENYYKNQSGSAKCILCPGITVSPNASTSLVNCTCPTGNEPALGSNSSGDAQNDPATYTSECQCSAGYYRPVPNASCTFCLPGSFNNISAAESCDICDVGKFADAPASTICQLCSPVIMCPTGQYWSICPGPVDGHCMQCSRRQLMPANASFSGSGNPFHADACPYKCNSGYDSVPVTDQLIVENPTACSACLRGKYRGKYTGSCSDCPSPTATLMEGSSYCVECSQGFCFNGFRRDGHADCIKCPSLRTTTQPNDYLQDFTDRCRCQRGYDGYSWGCTPCRPGTFKTDISESSDFALYSGSVGPSDECVECPGGSFNDEWAATEAGGCTGCALNSGTHGNTSRCICNAGYYDIDLSSNQASCDGCPEDTYNPAPGSESSGACIACPDVQHYSLPASPSQLNCTCNAGFSGDAQLCTPCPNHTYATLDDDVCISCPTGTFTRPGCDPTSLDVCLCPADTYGILVPGNWTRRYSPFYDWLLNNFATHHCIDCPVNSVAPAGATVQMQCVCMAGLSGNPGGGQVCAACPGNSYPWETAAYCSCNAGYYDNFSGRDSSLFIRTIDPHPADCTQCPSNAFSDNKAIGIEECRCNRGYYGHPENGKSSPCIQCPSGSYSNDREPVNKTFCTCNSGFSGDPGADVVCVECTSMDPNSHTHISTDTQSCTCDKGYFGDLYHPSSNSSCNACPVDSYNNKHSEKRASACIACQAFSTTDSVGSDQFSDCKCDLGYFHSGTDCVACAAAEYQDVRGSHHCEFCIANSISAEGSDADTDCKCAAGYYRVGGPSPGGACDFCPAGKFKMYIGDAECDACPGNSSSAADGSCECDEGFYGGPAPQFNGGCTACPADTRQPARNQFFVSACSDCPTNAIARPGSRQCVCTANAYGNPNANPPVPCVLCPTDALANEDSRIITDCECREGLFGDFSSPMPPEICSACPQGGTTSLGATTATDCRCSEGSYGDLAHNISCTLCSDNATSPSGTLQSSGCMCKANYYGDPAANISCTPCPDDSVSLENSREIEDCDCKQGYFGTPRGPASGRPVMLFVSSATAPSGTSTTLQLSSTPVPASANLVAGNNTNAANTTNSSSVAKTTGVSTLTLASEEACEACAKCPETHYGQQLVVGPEVSAEWNVSASFRPHLVMNSVEGNAWMDPAVIACRVVFPTTPQDALLWHLGVANRSTGNTRGASLGVRNANLSKPVSARNATLRLRAGESGEVNKVFVDVLDFPTDGKFHEVRFVMWCFCVEV